MCFKIKSNTSIAGTMPVYVTSTTKRLVFTEEISKKEFNALRRMRQLKNQGAKTVVIELSEVGPRVCTVGKPEG